MRALTSSKTKIIIIIIYGLLLLPDGRTAKIEDKQAISEGRTHSVSVSGARRVRGGWGWGLPLQDSDDWEGDNRLSYSTKKTSSIRFFFLSPYKHNAQVQSTQLVDTHPRRLAQTLGRENDQGPGSWREGDVMYVQQEFSVVVVVQIDLYKTGNEVHRCICDQPKRETSEKEKTKKETKKKRCTPNMILRS